MIDPILLQKISQEAGIDRFTVLREYLQIHFLQALYGQNNSSRLVFKGGTALRFLLPSNRYSEDLDFTTDLPKEAIMAFTQTAIEKISPHFPSITIWNLKTLTGISQKISYKSDLSTQPLNVKLDFSQRESVFFTKKGVIKTNLPINFTVVVTHLDYPEILAEKWRAITTRFKGRDLYDFWYLLHKNIPLNKELIQKKLDYYHESYNPQVLINKISDFDQKQLDSDLRKFLPESDREIIPLLKSELLSIFTPGN